MRGHPIGRGFVMIAADGLAADFANLAGDLVRIRSVSNHIT